MFFEETGTEAEGGSFWDSVVRSFRDQWWVFIITLAIVAGCLLIVNILTRGRFFKVKTIVKIGVHCLSGFVLLFVLNFFGGLFTGGAWALVPHWYSWIIIGIFGAIGVVFLLIASFVWPTVFTA